MLKKVFRSNNLFVFFWLAYVSLCLYFYIERCTYADNSYYLFNIIQHKQLNLESFRYSGIVSQWLALAAVKLQLNLKIILICFTLCPVIFHLCLFLLVYYISSNKLYAYTFVLVLIGCVYYSFFYTADELFENMSVFVVLIATIKSEKLKPILKYGLIFICQLILMFAHPLSIAVAGALLLIVFISIRNRTTTFSLVSIVVLLAIKMFVFSSGRDEGIIDTISYKGITLSHIHSSGFALYIRSIILKRHLVLVVLWCFLFYKGQASLRIKGLVLISIFSLYIIIMLFLLYNQNYVYMDRYLYLLLTFSFCVVLLVFRFEPISTKLQIGIWCIVAFSFFKLFTMNYLNNREQLLDKLLRQSSTKQIFLYDQMPAYIQQMSWAVPYETLIRSTLNGKAKTILIKEQFYKIDQYLQDSTLFLGAEWTFGKPNSLNKDYFPLEDVKYKYYDFKYKY